MGGFTVPGCIPALAYGAGIAVACTLAWSVASAQSTHTPKPISPSFNQHSYNKPLPKPEPPRKVEPSPKRIEPSFTGAAAQKAPAGTTHRASS